MPGVRSRLAIALLTAAAALPVATAAADTGIPGREADPIVVTGADIPALLGADPTRVVAFRREGGWRQIPVQVDERKQVDYAAVRSDNEAGGRPFSNLAYADPGTFSGADPDASLDSDDEIALMAMDAGDAAPLGLDDPEGVEAGTKVALRIADPVDPGSTRFVYLYRSAGGLDPGAGSDYVSYDFDLLSGDYKTTYSFGGVPGGNSTTSGPPANPENSVVDTDYYRERFASRWITDQLGLRAPGSTGVDVLDGDKAQVSFGCSRSELTFSRGGGGFIANIDGPIRAIRSYIGANSGTYTQRDQIFYQRSQVDHTYLRVHPGISTIAQYIDYSAAASGMTYRNSAAPGGVTIDATPDPVVQTGTTPGAPFVWEQTTGAQGTLSIITRAATNIPNIRIGSYYEDSATPAASQCNGYADDTKAYGASGMAITNAGVNTDPTLEGMYGPAYDFSGTRTIFYSGPGGDATLAQQRSDQVDNPLRVSLGDGGGGTGPELELRVRDDKRAKAGKRTKVRATLRNRGDGVAEGVELCLKVPRQAGEAGACRELRDLGAGARKKVKLPFAIDADARRHFRVKVVASASNADRAKGSAKIRLR